MPKDKTNHPVETLRIGHLQAAIWENRGENNRKFYNVTFSRTYKDGDELKNTDSFGHADLLNIAKLAERAEHRIEAFTVGRAGDQ